MQGLSQYEIKTCDVNESIYPEGLRAVKRKPSILYYKGNIEILNMYRNVAVIGSRRCSQEGLRMSYHAGREVAKLGMNLVNGLALGCDTLALKGALSVGGRCIAILPCGLNQILPKSNTDLADEILENGGCLLSEYQAGINPQKYQYVERDRLQSGVSQGVLVIEADEKSGTMHTADFAAQQFKRLACYSHSLMKNASGNRLLEVAGKAQIIGNQLDLQMYLQNTKQETQGKQMTLEL